MSAIAARMESISGRYLGCPYLAHSLVGSADTPEVFNHSLQHFDCVTYIESIVALAYTNESPGFTRILKKLRYADGRVDWRRRNHYMTHWLTENVRQGLVARVGAKWATTRKARVLNVVQGLPPRRQSFSCIPKQRFSRLQLSLRTGDLIFFASTRAHLDVFHCGILIRGENGWILRHASRRQGRVVDQDLQDFFKENRMAGVMLARPLDRRRG